MPEQSVDAALVPARAAAPAPAFAPDVARARAEVLARGRRLFGAGFVVVVSAIGAAAYLLAVLGDVVGAASGIALVVAALAVAARITAGASRLARRVRRLDPLRDVVFVAPEGGLAFFSEDGWYAPEAGRFVPYDEGGRPLVLAVRERLGAITLKAQATDDEEQEPPPVLVRIPSTWTDDDTVRVAAKLAAYANRLAPR